MNSQNAVGFGECQNKNCDHKGYHMFYREVIDSGKMLQCPKCMQHKVKIKNFTAIK